MCDLSSSSVATGVGRWWPGVERVVPAAESAGGRSAPVLRISLFP